MTHARKRASRRGHPGAVVVAGRRPVAVALRAGLATEVLVSRTARTTEGLRELLAEAERGGIAVARIGASEIERLAGDTTHQGVVARTTPPRELGEADLAQRDWPSDAIVLALDGVTDPHNLGAAARTADAAGAAALVIRRHRGAGLGAIAVKASAGALLLLPVARVANIARALGRLKEAGFWVVGLDDSAAATIATPRPSGRLALVVGSEGEGLSRLVGEACDEVLAIPMRGRVASLNVSVAAAVGLYAYALREPEKQE